MNKQQAQKLIRETFETPFDKIESFLVNIFGSAWKKGDILATSS